MMVFFGWSFVIETCLTDSESPEIINLTTILLRHLKRATSNRPLKDLS